MVVINGKKILSGSILTAALEMLIGLVLLIWPGGTLIVACRIIGIAMLAMGIISIIFSMKSSEMISGKAKIGGSVILIIAAVFVLIQPDLLASVIPFVAGAWLLFHGVRNVIRGINLLQMKDQSWWLALIFGIVSVVLGIILFSKPFEAASVVVRLIGLFFLVDGATNLWSSFRVSKARKNGGVDSEPIDVEATIIDE